MQVAFGQPSVFSETNEDDPARKAWRKVGTRALLYMPCTGRPLHVASLCRCTCPALVRKGSGGLSSCYHNPQLCLYQDATGASVQMILNCFPEFSHKCSLTQQGMSPCFSTENVKKVRKGRCYSKCVPAAVIETPTHHEQRRHTDMCNGGLPTHCNCRSTLKSSK
jgi:hypothetical protein